MSGSMTRIEALYSTDIKKITSGQVIIDLRSAVKELLENSLDANADKIEIIFKNYGIESVECSDNGDGISEGDFNEIGCKHHTSKISSFKDVSSVTSFGFRGEAIASLCQMSKLSIITTTTGPKATKLQFNHSGLISKQVCSRSKGTTVSISDLFDALPVRKKEFVKNHRRQFSKTIELIQSYAIIQNSVKIAVWNILPSGKKSLVVSSIGKSDINRNLVSVFGSNATKGLEPIDINLDISQQNPNIISAHDDIESEFMIKVVGKISSTSFGCGRVSKDRQFLYINKRPVNYPKISKCINETYQSFNNVQFPTFILDFQVNSVFLDLNVTPDKRTVNIHYEEYIIDLLTEKLQLFFQQQGLVLPKSDVGVNQMPNSKRMNIEPLDDSITHKNDDSMKPYKDACNDFIESLPTNGTATKREKTGSTYYTRQREDTFNDNKEKLGEGKENDATMEARQEEENDASEEVRGKEMTRTLDIEYHNPVVVENAKTGEVADHSFDESNTKNISKDSSVVKLDAHKNRICETESKKSYSQMSLNSFLHVPNSTEASREHTQELIPELEKVVVEIDDEITTHPVSRDKNDKLVFHSQQSKQDIVLHCCSEDEEICFHDSVESLAAAPPISSKSTSPEPKNSLQESGALQNLNNLITEARVSLSDLIKESKMILNHMEIDRVIKHERLINEIASIDNKEKAEEYLTLKVSKEDFCNMEIVGQFNLGFIIVTRKKEDTFDLFILDQHASDEKFNFEMLQRNTVFKSQSLLSPKILELSIIDELLVIEYEDIFNKNGFKLKIELSEEPGKRVNLVSFPVSKNTMFTEQDFHELIHLIREHDGHNMSNIRCSKIRSMYAMRACRSSIMIGKPLSKKTMKRVVSNLSELDKPWNCPHGRPTLRHLMELKDWETFQDDYII